MPKTVTHEAKSDIKRLTYRRFEVVRLFGGCNRLVEAEKDGVEICFRPVAGIWLELRLDAADEGRTDCGEHADLRKR